MPVKGGTASLETRQRQSEAQKRRFQEPVERQRQAEHCLRISEANVGKPLSEEHKTQSVLFNQHWRR